MTSLCELFYLADARERGAVRFSCPAQYRVAAPNHPHGPRPPPASASSHPAVRGTLQLCHRQIRSKNLLDSYLAYGDMSFKFLFQYLLQDKNFLLTQQFPSVFALCY